MDENHIAQVLTNALTQGVSLQSPPPMLNPQSFAARMTSRCRVEADQTIIDAVVLELEKVQGLGLLLRGIIFLGNIGGTRLFPSSLANWLLARAIIDGPAAAAASLKDLIGGKNHNTIEVVALSGILVQEEIELREDISLVPFDALPGSGMKDMVSGVSTFALSDIGLSFRPFPDAALVLRKPNGLRLLEDFPPSGTSIPTNEALLLDIARFLTLCGPVASTPVAYWEQVEEWEKTPIPPAFVTMRQQYNELFPTATYNIDREDIAPLLDAYLSLHQDTKRKLDVATRRLNLAMCRHSDLDAAIELRVALESLLTADRDSDASIGYSLRTRGALLLGSDFESRSSINSLLNKVYAMCSGAVHTGKLETKKSDKKEKPEDILWEGLLICTKVLRKIIRDGSLPDWNKLILGG